MARKTESSAALAQKACYQELQIFLKDAVRNLDCQTAAALEYCFGTRVKLVV